MSTYYISSFILFALAFSNAEASCVNGDAFCASTQPGSYCKYWSTPSTCQGTGVACSCDAEPTTTILTTGFEDTTLAVTTADSTSENATPRPTTTRTHLRSTTPKPTAAPATTTHASAAPPSREVRFGTYSWSQSYWRNGDSSLTDFGASDMGMLWNSGDVYVNIADYSNYDQIYDGDLLVAWMKEWRSVTGNTERIFLTYGDADKHYNQRMVDFVDTFERFLEEYVSSEDMREIAPIGLSFDAEGMDSSYVKETLENAQDMKTRISQKNGYLPGSLLIDFAVSGDLNPLATQYVMQLADHATFEVFRNAIDGDGLVQRVEWMLTQQCAVCTQPGWENLKAKITILVEGSCTNVDYCHKVSMCAYDSAAYPNKDGGIQYVWDTVNELTDRMISDKLVTTEQFNYLFDTDGTLFSMNNWEWTRCYYGDSFSKEMGYTSCSNYHVEGSTCRAN
ncbi:hypothetical protein FOL47_010530 [Perkinsus chesapeaki]|uniref:Uncharacterized protein n=1 Tax=Perkinsus chesapeaki TaxID=330153 RepID=A0A7J6MQ79_PERCH|nr:hypothetical protein FOL47_010530 [Perkinsus chesapeaki]